jgi:hypothetical protein
MGSEGMHSDRQPGVKPQRREAAVQCGRIVRFPKPPVGSASGYPPEAANHSGCGEFTRSRRLRNGEKVQLVGVAIRRPQNGNFNEKFH